MTTKIAAPDATAMNTLFSQELAKAGVKTAADEKIDAFADHSEYVGTLEKVLGDDNSEGWNPNDPKLD